VTRRASRTRAGLLFAVVSAVSFGTVAIGAKLAYEQGATPLPLLAVRFAVAALLIGAFRELTRRRAAPRDLGPREKRVWRRPIVRMLLLGAFGYGLESALYFAALERAPASVVGLVFYTYPLWTNIIGFATGLERFGLRPLVALGLGGSGVALIFSLGEGSTAGLLLSLAAALAVAVYFVTAQVLVRGVDPVSAAVYTAVGAALALTSASVVTVQGIPATAIPWAAGIGAVTAVAFITMYSALVRLGSARTSIAQMLEPVATVLLAAIFLAEPITGKVVLGATLIVSALPILATGQVDGKT
jgi:drug/metabolite transporter (DMT)-like permease